MVSSAVVLAYRDAPAAIDWLRAVGFDVLQRQDGPGGEVVHCELRLDDAVVMLASADAEYDVPPLIGQSTGVGVYLVTGDVDGMFSRALGAGGIAVIAPSTPDGEAAAPACSTRAAGSGASGRTGRGRQDRRPAESTASIPSLAISQPADFPVR